MCLHTVWTHLDWRITRRWLAGTVLIAEGLLVLILARRHEMHRVQWLQRGSSYHDLQPLFHLGLSKCSFGSRPCPSTKAAIPEFRTLIAELEAWRNCDSVRETVLDSWSNGKPSVPKEDTCKQRIVEGLSDAQHSGQGQTCQKHQHSLPLLAFHIISTITDIRRNLFHIYI